VRVLELESASGSRYSGAGWFVAAALASVGGSALGRLAGPHTAEPGLAYPLMGASALAILVVAGLATWRIVRCRADSWLLPLAALNLALLDAGRAGDVATWRVEWAVCGIALTCAAVLLFARLLARTDELQRRIHVEGAAIGLVLALPLAMAYALVEPWLPPLRAEWVTMALLLLWWGGWLATARRYR
jgi:hypothetical protein